MLQFTVSLQAYTSNAIVTDTVLTLAAVFVLHTLANGSQQNRANLYNSWLNYLERVGLYSSLVG